MAIYLKVQFSTKICPFLAIICGLCVIDLLLLTKHGHPMMHVTRHNMGILANISVSKIGVLLWKIVCSMVLGSGNSFRYYHGDVWLRSIRELKMLHACFHIKSVSIELIAQLIVFRYISLHWNLLIIGCNFGNRSSRLYLEFIHVPSPLTSLRRVTNNMQY